MKKMTAVFEKLQTYVNLLALPSEYVCFSLFILKNLENKNPEEGDGLAWLSETSLGSGVRKTQIQIFLLLTHSWTWANNFTFLYLFSHLWNGGKYDS